MLDGMTASPTFGPSMNFSDLKALNEILRKDLLANYGSPATYPVSALTSGSPLIPQSIEATLALAVVDVAREVKLWPKLAKDVIFSTVHEFTRVKSRGANITPFTAEGSLPPYNAGEYERLFAKVKYLVNPRLITDQMAQMRILGGDANAIALEDRMGTQQLLLDTEWSLFWADSRVNPFAFDGLLSAAQQFASGTVVDMRGKNLTEEVIRAEIAKAHQKFFAIPDEIWMSYTSHQILSTLRGGNQRYTDSRGMNQVTAGVTVNDVPTSTGLVLTSGNISLNPRVPQETAQGAQAPSVPGAPNAPSYTPGAVGGGQTSLFGQFDQGNYIYRMVAVGPAGCSAPVNSAVVPVAAGQKVVISVGTGNESGILYYDIYRTPVGCDAGAATWIGSVPFKQGSATTYDDLNQMIGGTTIACSVTYDPSIYKVVRLLDLMRRGIPYPGLAIAFAILLFATPLYQVPTKMGPTFINVGQNMP